MFDELEKELKEAYWDVRWKMKRLEIFLSFFPERIDPKTYPPQVVTEEEKVIREFYEAKDRFTKALKRYEPALKMEQQKAYYQEMKNTPE